MLEVPGFQPLTPRDGASHPMGRPSIARVVVLAQLRPRGGEKVGSFIYDIMPVRNAAASLTFQLAHAPAARRPVPARG